MNRSGTVRFYLLRKLECLRHAADEICFFVFWFVGAQAGPLSRCVLRAAPRFARFAWLGALGALFFLPFLRCE